MGKKRGPPFKAEADKLIQVKFGLRRDEIDRLVQLGGTISAGIRKLIELSRQERSPANQFVVDYFKDKK